MALAYSSDEDSEETLIPDSVTEYQFEDEEESPTTFSNLPLDSPSAKSPQVYLRGTSEDKLQKVYQPATAWKVELSRKLCPEVFVLSKGKWVKLLKPRKVYESIIRGVLISIQALHFLKWNPDSSEKNLWDNLRRVFDKFEVRPSEDDFRHHRAFMKHLAEKDETLAKSQILKGFLEVKGRRTGEGNSGAPEVKQPFIAEDDEVEMRDAGGDESEEEDSDLFDSVCCICDNGGDLLCCEGECMRSFHATEEAGEESKCESLGLTSVQVEAIQNFLCDNCKVKQHQCFACGKLGNSDKSKGAEVFQCSNATCGYFYHPNCVSKLLFPEDEAAASQCEKIVLEGRFACPCHRCAVCKKLEDKAVPDLQFAMCRRCPKSYHRKCLPRKISFTEDRDNGILIRAWEDLLPNRILIYCLNHKIDKKLMTPSRDHILFPEMGTTRAKKKVGSLEVPSHKQKPPVAKRHESSITRNREISPSERRPLKKMRGIPVEEVPSSKGRALGNPSHPSKGKAVSLRKVQKLRENDSSKEQVSGTKSIKKVKKLRENGLFGEESSGTALGRSKSPSPQELTTGDSPRCSRNIPRSSFPVPDATVENKMKEFLAKESVTVNDVLKKKTIPRTHQYSGRHIEKVTRGKIEGSVEAIQTAYQRIINGGNVDDAKAVCEPDVVKQVVKWHKKLGVYLSPFMHGMRYTSFGRHFTKEEKLQEICNKLQWYVKNNDTIVDFCCGSNDFSRIMKEKMDALGKTCHYKNYDIVPPKNDFCYEKRDWMTVKPKELPDGGSLIMGLNPPFGTKAGLANKFIDKALTFKPKLVILIVPKETERLDQKQAPYDLVWVDSVMLSGKSFYLPGSVDVNDKQMEQWNVTPPLLYLWSRPDWSACHKGIAAKHGHFSELSQGVPASPPDSPPPSVEQQKEAEDIISQVVGDISVINDEVTEMRQQECFTSSEGKDKVDPGPWKIENQVKTETAIPKRKDGKDVDIGTTIEEVKKFNDRTQRREKKGLLEEPGSHGEVGGINHQNEGEGGNADRKSGESSSLKEVRAIKPNNEGTLRQLLKEHTDNRYHNGGATRDLEEPRVLETHSNLREARSHRNGKLSDVREGSSYKNKISHDTRDINRSSPEVRPSAASYIRRRSPPGIIDSRLGKMRESEDRAAGTLNNGNISDMDISSPENNSQLLSAIRCENAANWENNNNRSRYDNPSNTGNGYTHQSESNNNSRYDSTSNRVNPQREKNNTASGYTLPLAGPQYISNDPLEQLIETRQLDSHPDFSDLDPILNSENNNFNDMGRQYPTSSSYDWPYGESSMGYPSGFLEHNHSRVPDSMVPGGLEDFEGLSRFYGSNDENRQNNFVFGPTGQPGNTIHNSASIPLYASSDLGGSTRTSVPSYNLSSLGGSTSTSTMDKYAPRLDETNFLRPGGSFGGPRQFHQGVGGLGGSSGPPHYSYDMHASDRRDMPPSYPDLPGYVPPHLQPFRPPPGSSGGWIGD